MKPNSRSLLVLAALAACVALATPVLAEDAHVDPATTVFLTDFARVTDKLVSLAEELSQEQHGWRPADGVRSASEVFMHVANANFFLSKAIGGTVPADLPEDLEKVTDKAKVIELLKASIETVKATAAATHDLETEVEVFGAQRSKRAVLTILTGHNHEHLGQSIAYARSNGVVPPWSRKE